jgi:CRISPR-associated protein Cas2
VSQQFVVVVYDISDDKRRTRLHKRLRDFGSPVQFSVFECVLSAKQLKGMKAALQKIIRPRIDHVRLYFLDEAARKKIEVFGRKKVTEKPDSLVV